MKFRPPAFSRVSLLLAAVLSLSGAPALAQMDSREGIALQNQILERSEERRVGKECRR